MCLFNPLAATDDISDKEHIVVEKSQEEWWHSGGKGKEEKITRRAVWRASTEAIMRDYRELLNLPVCTD